MKLLHRLSLFALGTAILHGQLKQRKNLMEIHDELVELSSDVTAIKSSVDTIATNLATLGNKNAGDTLTADDKALIDSLVSDADGLKTQVATLAAPSTADTTTPPADTGTVGTTPGTTVPDEVDTPAA